MFQLAAADGSSKSFVAVNLGNPIVIQVQQCPRDVYMAVRNGLRRGDRQTHRPIPFFMPMTDRILGQKRNGAMIVISVDV